MALIDACEPFAMQLGDTLATPGARLQHAYFPVSGYISVLTGNEVTDATELGLVGNEGMFGATLLLGVARSPQTALVQGVGVARIITAAALTDLLGRLPALNDLLSRYLYVTIAQIGQTAACNRSHRVDVRLARWLLMTQDCAHGSTFTLTHKFLAYMLGVRRAGVTEAALALQAAGLIRYTRGSVTVIDRAGLLQKVCGCYTVLKAEYQTTMGSATATRRAPARRLHP